MKTIPHFFTLMLLIAVPTGAFSAALTQDSSTSAANNYPNKAVRLIVPYVAGGGTDSVARLIAQKLSDNFNQQVVVDNRAGANGIIGASIAAKATPDGYTMVLFAVDHFINGATHKKLPYDTMKDFAAVTHVGTQSLVLVVSPSMPVRSVKDLVELAKAKPKELSFGSWGYGSLAHLVGELMKITAGVEMVHVPYAGAPQAMIDILGGRLNLIFSVMPPAVPHIKSGKLRALAVTMAKRAPVLPDVPTMIESGYPKLEVESWRGMYVPAGTPKPIIRRLNAEIVKILQEKDVKVRMLAMGFDTITSTPEQLDAFTKAELAKWVEVAKAAGVRLDSLTAF
jgi:tripartite-type tricarboxylate transporter receptor subunit TctC